MELLLESETVSSGDDITRTDFDLSVELTNLTITTMYYYRVQANNTVNATLSALQSFTTTDLRESLGMVPRLHCIFKA